MPRIRKTIEIDSSPDNVFKYVTNISTQPDWIRFIQEAEVVSGDGRSKGTKDRVLFKLGPRAQVVEGLWTEYDPPRTFARKAATGMDIEGRIALQPKNDTTQVVWTIDYKPPMGALGTLVDALFMNRVFQNEMEESLETLKAQLEG